MTSEPPRDERIDGHPARRYLLAQCVVLPLIAAVATYAVLGLQNTLDRNGGWSSSKLELDYGVIGAVATMVTRPPLAGGRLDLGTYHGFQELWRDETRPVRSLEFSFRSDAPAYLDVLFGRHRSEFAGVRLSLHPDFDHIRFTSADREFIEAERIRGLPNLSMGRWLTAKTTFAPRRMTLEVEGIPPITLAQPFDDVRAVGFRGSQSGPLLDDLEVHFDSPPPLSEPFSNRRHLLLTFAVTLGGAGILVRLSFAAFVGLVGLDRRRAFLACLLVSLVALVCLSMFAAVDRFYLSQRYPEYYGVLGAAGYSNRLEQPEEAILRIANEIASLADDGRSRVLLVGSSQTWGAGASRRETTWASVLEQELARGGREVSVVNTGIAGARASALLPPFKYAWLRILPDLVVVNLAHNDTDLAAFGAAMTEFANVCRQREVPLVFVLEPNATEAPTRVVERHELTRRLAKGRDTIRVVDMHDHLHRKRETGHLWWDPVHLTDYGQRLFSKKLAQEVLPLLPP